MSDRINKFNSFKKSNRYNPKDILSQKEIDELLSFLRGDYQINNYENDDKKILSNEEYEELLRCLSRGEFDFESNDNDDIMKKIHRENVINEKLEIIKLYFYELNKDNIKNETILSKIESSVDDILKSLDIDYEEYKEKEKEYIKEILFK